MTATGHAVLGTIIAAKVGNPALAIPLALLSHVAADIFPHWDVATNGNTKNKKDKRKLLILSFFDVLLGFTMSFIILSVFFSKTNLSYAFLLIIVSQLFDWMVAPYYFFNIDLPPFNWTYKFQKLFDNELDKPWGIINQIAVLFLILVLAKVF